MSSQSTPSKEATLMEGSSMDGSSTFYSINDSDLDNMNMSQDLMNNLLVKPAKGSFSNVNESTLNFLSEARGQSTGTIKPDDEKNNSNPEDSKDTSTIIIEDSSYDEVSSSGEDDFSNKTDDDKTPAPNDNSNASSRSDFTKEEPTIKIYKSLSEFDLNLPRTVTKLATPHGSLVYLVGTAHFSKESQDDVSLVIRNVQPDVVMVELCPGRIHILKLDEKTLLEEARDINIPKIRSLIKTNGLVNGIFYIVLLNMSAKITKELGMAPGGEFRRAFEEIQRLDNCILQLGDRPLNITLQRALHGLSTWQTIKIFWKLLTSQEKITKEDVEQCKQQDLIEELMQEMAGEYPAFRDVFVSERDLFLCHSLQIAALPQNPIDGSMRPVKVVGVVGIGHCAGIAQHWGKVDSSKIPEITKIPPASLSNRMFKFSLRMGILSLIGYGVYRIARPTIQRMM
ncbi:TraB domain-containing protein [Pseudolycoriella hygida]|uniref:TraB domain-containing protein n=1 Tax=Pseudolycoriella hygida TaxID=35572 RepID=A0A9Q0MWN1_9DIPT|nr:TraB domain-containing protein [Pseudolycoriella hygida]